MPKECQLKFLYNNNDPKLSTLRRRTLYLFICDVNYVIALKINYIIHSLYIVWF